MYYNALLQLTCEHCGIDYEAQRHNSRYCSGKCRTAACRGRAHTRRCLKEIGLLSTERTMSAWHIRRLDRIRGYSWNVANMVHELQKSTNAEIAEKAVEMLNQLFFDLNVPVLDENFSE